MFCPEQPARLGRSRDPERAGADRDEVIALVKRLGGTRFQPTSDVIAGRIAALVETGLLSALPDDTPGDVRWQPAASGRAHLQRLLMTPERVARGCPGGRVRLSQDLLLGDARARSPGRADGRSDGGAPARLSQAQAALSSCPCRCVFVQRCLARDVERWEAELIWLEALGSEVAPARPWRH